MSGFCIVYSAKRRDTITVDCSTVSFDHLNYLEILRSIDTEEIKMICFRGDKIKEEQILGVLLELKNGNFYVSLKDINIKSPEFMLNVFPSVHRIVFRGFVNDVFSDFEVDYALESLEIRTNHLEIIKALGYDYGSTYVYNLPVDHIYSLMRDFRGRNLYLISTNKHRLLTFSDFRFSEHPHYDFFYHEDPHFIKQHKKYWILISIILRCERENKWVIQKLLFFEFLFNFI